MSDIEIAREAAAKAQANEHVAAMIRSGQFDHWPNVQGALSAMQAMQQPGSSCTCVTFPFGRTSNAEHGSEFR